MVRLLELHRDIIRRDFRRDRRSPRQLREDDYFAIR